MAFGCSSPEILLSIIEISGENFQAGELGPGIYLSFSQKKANKDL